MWHLQAEALKFLNAVGIPNNSVKTAMLIGGGKITYYLAKMLKDTQIKLKIIEKDMDRCRFLSEEFPHAIIIHGDAADQTLLLEEGIRQTEAFAH